MTLFPQAPVTIGSIATASLREVVRGRHGLVGRFTLQPGDRREFVDRIGGLGRNLGVAYRPLPGTWATYVVPEDRDDVDFLVGLDAEYGRALAKAHRTLKTGAKSLVAPLTVRSLALGFLQSAGV